ncbi:MAG TPA: contractile injection system protein, VgrG/Pvc8 family, partial [Symbiobacteriaceae bacterium]|nr:contractile injection system protein, VgrG/Pvc8 family [Symbiobacteriaceae bacterium]
HDLRMTRRTRGFEEMSDSAIISQVIGDAGLTASVSVTGVEQHALVVQLNQSDLAFIRDRARAVDAEVWADGTTVNVKSRSDRATAEVTLAYGEELLEFSVLADLAGQRSEVRVTGWDVTSKTAISSAATDSVISSELAGLTGGSSVLTSALAARVEQVVHHHPVVEAEAKFLAEATFRRLARRFLTGMGVAEGKPQIRVGCKVKLEGVGTLFSGSYYVTEVRHMVDRTQGYRTQFRVERPGIGG